uniref:Uncharacterized protein n=1 Tax=Photinus pyralis TaxID=7054 RepID=A0A1Y1NIX2_PHOPY
MAASRMQRWAVILSAYQFDIKFITSAKNANADYLSRLPLPVSKKDTPDLSNFNYLSSSLPVDFKQIAKETRNDLVLNAILGYCLHGWNTCDDRNVGKNFKCYFEKRDQLHVEHNCILSQLAHNLGIRKEISRPNINIVTLFINSGSIYINIY